MAWKLRGLLSPNTNKVKKVPLSMLSDQARVQKSLNKKALEKMNRENVGQKTLVKNTGEVGPNIPPGYKHQEAKYDIHTYPNKNLPDELVQEAGYVDSSLGKLRRTDFQPTTKGTEFRGEMDLYGGTSNLDPKDKSVEFLNSLKKIIYSKDRSK